MGIDAVGLSMPEIRKPGRDAMVEVVEGVFRFASSV